MSWSIDLEVREGVHNQRMNDYIQNSNATDEEVENLIKLLQNKEEAIWKVKASIAKKEKEIAILKEKIKIKKEMQIHKETYVAEDNDPIDFLVATYCNQPGKTVPVKRISANNYMFGTIKITTALSEQVPNDFTVTVVKDDQTLERQEFFDLYEFSELEKLEQLRTDQEMHVDEESKIQVMAASPAKE